MAGLGGFFGQALIGAGMGIQGGQQFQQQEQQLQMNQQRIDSNKMSMMMQKQHMEAKKDLGDYLQQKVAEDQDALSSPAKAAKVYNEAATRAFMEHDFDLGEQMAKLAEGQQVQAQKAVVTQAKEDAENKDKAADAAWQFTQGDMQDPENQKVFAKALMDAKIDPSGVPSLMKPVAMQTYAKSLALTSKQGIARAKMLEDAAAKKDVAEAKKEQLKETAQYHQELIEEKALTREALAENRAERKAAKAEKTPPEKFVIEDDIKWQLDPDHQMTGERKDPTPGTPGNRYVKFGDAPLSSHVDSAVRRTVQAGAEIARNLEALNHFKDTSLSPFAALGNDTLIGALLRTGTKAPTPDLVNAYGATLQGLGTEYGSMMAAFGGRMVGEHAQKDWQSMVSRESGESSIVGAYKLANAAEVFRTYIRALPHAEKNQKVQEMLKQIEDIPPSAAILSKMQSDADKKRAKKVGAVADKMKVDTSAVIANPVGGNSPDEGLPPSAEVN